MDEQLTEYAVGKLNIIPTIAELAAPMEQGGCRLSHPTLYGDLFFLKPVKTYINHRISDSPRTAQIAIIEFNIGQQLSSKFHLPHINNFPHSETPSTFYQHSLDLIEKYNLTLTQIAKSTIKSHFSRLCTLSQAPSHHSFWPNLHHPIFPNYIKTFNYKLARNLLPISTKFRPFNLDNNTSCPFCNLQPESNLHLFHNCPKIKPVLTFLGTILKTITSFDISTLHDTKHIYLYTPSSLLHSHHLDAYLYLTAITHHKIWAHRNLIVHNQISFNPIQIISSIKRSISCRTTLEEKRTDTTFLPVFQDLKNYLH